MLFGTKDPVILNPAWNDIIHRAVGEEEGRIGVWVKSILLPFIEDNAHDFCLRLHRISDIYVPFYERDEPLYIDIEAVCHNMRPKLVKHNSPAADKHIANFNVTHTNREIAIQNPGWLNATPMRMRIDTQISITFCARSHEELSARAGESEYFLYVGHNDLHDLLDWLTTAAKIPLNPTKLPYKEAVRLSEEWHEKQRRKAAKQKPKNIPLGLRETLGNLTIKEGFSISPANYRLEWLKDSAALQYETLLMHHCVWSYAVRVERNECIILHLQNTASGMETDRWTIELTSAEALWGKEGVSNHLIVRQFRGINNTTAHPELITGFGNLFLNGADGKSSLFEETINIKPLVEHLKLHQDIPI